MIIGYKDITLHQTRTPRQPPSLRNLVVEVNKYKPFLFFLFWCYFLAIIFMNDPVFKRNLDPLDSYQGFPYFQLFWHCKGDSFNH